MALSLCAGTMHVALTEGAVAFTDGSSIGNPGPTGAGIAVFTPVQRGGWLATLLAWPVAKMGTNNKGELSAIWGALELHRAGRDTPPKPLHIFTDSRVVMTWLGPCFRGTPASCERHKGNQAASL